MTKVDAQPVMEPRLQERRTSLARNRRRRLLRVIAIAAGILLALGAIVGVFFTPIFDVDRVVVRGSRALSADTVRAASGVRRGDPMLLVRTGAVAKRVERLPYVQTARVKRVFPGTVIITVQERKPIAWTSEDEQGAELLDATGRVLATTNTPPTNLPRITGFANVPGPGKVVRPSEIVTALTELPPGLRSLVATVAWDGNELTLTLVDGLQVRLGDTGDIRAKGAVAEAVIDRSPEGTKVVDVRVPTSPISK